MKTAHDQSILVVSRKRTVQPLLSELRSAGHQVSVVEDLDEAQSFLEEAKFDHALVPAKAFRELLDAKAAAAVTELEAWRRSLQAINHDLMHVLRVLRRRLGEQNGGNKPDDDGVDRAIAALVAYLGELGSELDAAWNQSIRPSIFSLEGVIEAAAIASYAPAADRQQRLTINVDEEVETVRADGTKLKRILSAMLAFASEYGCSGGTVEVRAYRDFSSEIVVSVSYSADEMSRSELRKLFARDRTGRHNLSAAQSLAELHECRLWVESQTGAGTTLFLSLPAWARVSRRHRPSGTRA